MPSQPYGPDNQERNADDQEHDSSDQQPGRDGTEQF
jgi:hypothetical protein